MPTTHTDSCDSHSQLRQPHTWHAYSTARQLWQPLPAETGTQVACLQHSQTAVTATPSWDSHTRGMPTAQPDSCDIHSQLRQPHTWHAYNTDRQLWQPLPAETATHVACLQHTQTAVTATPSRDSHTRGMPTAQPDSCDSHSQLRQAHTWHAYSTARQLWQPLPAETGTQVACLQHTQIAVTATPSRDSHTRSMPTTQPDSCDSHSQPRQPHTWHAYNTARQLWQPLPAETATHVACLQHSQTAVTATPSRDSHTRGMPTTQPDSCDSHSQPRQPHTWHAYNTHRQLWQPLPAETATHVACLQHSQTAVTATPSRDSHTRGMPTTQPDSCDSHSQPRQPHTWHAYNTHRQLWQPLPAETATHVACLQHTQTAVTATPAETATHVACLQHSQIAVTATPSRDSHTRGMPTTHTDSCNSHSQLRQPHTWHAYNTHRQLWQPLPAETATHVACLQHSQIAVTATPSRDSHTCGMPTTHTGSCDSHSQLRQAHTWHAYNTHRQLWQPLPAETAIHVACLQHTQTAVTATPSRDSHTHGMPTTHTDSCDSHSQPRQPHTRHSYSTHRQLWQPLPAETATHVACIQRTQTAVTATPSRDSHTRGMPITHTDSCDSHSQPRQAHTWHAYNTDRQLWQPLPAETAIHVACIQHTQTAVTATPSRDRHTRGMPTTQTDSCDSHSQPRQPYTWHAYNTHRQLWQPLPAETGTHVACLQHRQTAVTATPSRDSHTRGILTAHTDSCDSHSQPRQPHTWHAYNTHRQLWQPLPAETATHVACLQHSQTAVMAWSLIMCLSRMEMRRYGQVT